MAFHRGVRGVRPGGPGGAGGGAGEVGARTRGDGARGHRGPAAVPGVRAAGAAARAGGAGAQAGVRGRAGVKGRGGGSPGVLGARDGFGFAWSAGGDDGGGSVHRGGLRMVSGETDHAAVQTTAVGGGRRRAAAGRGNAVTAGTGAASTETPWRRHPKGKLWAVNDAGPAPAAMMRTGNPKPIRVPGRPGVSWGVERPPRTPAHLRHRCSERRRGDAGNALLP